MRSGMQRPIGGLAALLALVLLVASASAGVASAAAPAPAPGRHGTSGHLPGSFVVTGSRVSDLHGMTARGVNRGCVVGEHVTVLGTLPITHQQDVTTGADYYAVFDAASGQINELVVRVRLQGGGSRRHPAKAHVVSGGLEMYFPGAVAAPAFISPSTGTGSLTYSSPSAGICHVVFDFS